MTTVDQATAGARRHAKSAAIRDLGVTACPYPAEGTSLQSAARGAWFGEYLRRRPLVGLVDYSGDVEALAAGIDPAAGTVDGHRPDATPAGEPLTIGRNR